MKQYFLCSAFFLSTSIMLMSSDATKDATYEELDMLGARCNDTCTEPGRYDDLSIYTCHCGSYCADLNTCCLDSPYRDRMRKRIPSQTCSDVFGSHYFISGRCSLRWRADRTIRRMCERGWAGQDDLLLLAPVTSLETNVTYKNYFCLQCNEKSEKVKFWNLFVQADDAPAEAEGEKNMVFGYDRRGKTWMASVDTGRSYFPVDLKMLPPQDVQPVLRSCYPDVVSHCARDWRDASVRRKCDSYTALVMIFSGPGTVRYRNPHCALCNWQDLKKKGCRTFSGYGAKRPFSFALLLDINRSDGDKVGMVERCGDGSVWDPYFKKCRTLACALPGQVVKDGKCTAV